MVADEVFAQLASDVALRVQRRRSELESSACVLPPAERLAAARLHVRRGAAQLAAVLAAAEALELEQAYESCLRGGAAHEAGQRLAAWRAAEADAHAKARAAAEMQAQAPRMLELEGGASAVVPSSPLPLSSPQVALAQPEAQHSAQSFLDEAALAEHADALRRAAQPLHCDSLAALERAVFAPPLDALPALLAHAAAAAHARGVLSQATAATTDGDASQRVVSARHAATAAASALASLRLDVAQAVETGAPPEVVRVAAEARDAAENLCVAALARCMQAADTARTAQEAQERMADGVLDALGSTSPLKDDRDDEEVDPITCALDASLPPMTADAVDAALDAALRAWLEQVIPAGQHTDNAGRELQLCASREQGAWEVCSSRVDAALQSALRCLCALHIDDAAQEEAAAAADVASADAMGQHLQRLERETAVSDAAREAVGSLRAARSERMAALLALEDAESTKRQGELRGEWSLDWELRHTHSVGDLQARLELAQLHARQARARLTDEPAVAALPEVAEALRESETGP